MCVCVCVNEGSHGSDIPKLEDSFSSSLIGFSHFLSMHVALQQREVLVLSDLGMRQHLLDLGMGQCVC